MPITANSTTPRRRSVNMTIREDIMKTAKALRLNASKAAEAGIVRAIREAQEHEWRTQSRAAIERHNKRIEQTGPLLTPHWAEIE